MTISISRDSGKWILVHAIGVAAFIGVLATSISVEADIVFLDDGSALHLGDQAIPEFDACNGDSLPVDTVWAETFPASAGEAFEFHLETMNTDQTKLYIDGTFVATIGIDQGGLDCDFDINVVFASVAGFDGTHEIEVRCHVSPFGNYDDILLRNVRIKTAGASSLRSASWGRVKQLFR